MIDSTNQGFGCYVIHFSPLRERRSFLEKALIGVRTDWVTRRRYREVFAHKVRKKSEVLAEIKFPEHQKYPGRVLQVPSNLSFLEKCQKSGSWVINYLPMGRPYIWTSKQRRYFLGLPNISHSLAADPSLLANSIEL